MSATLNMLDLIFIIFGVIFTATAFLRGFIKELFSFLTWLISFSLAYFLSPYIAKLIAVYSSNMVINNIVARFAIFVTVFVIIVFTSANLKKDLRDKIPHSFDRSLGVLFGIVKTVIIFGLIYSVYINIYVAFSGRDLSTKRKANRVLPTWFKESKSSGIIRISADISDPAVKKFMEDFVDGFSSQDRDQFGFEDKFEDIVDEKLGRDKYSNDEETQDKVIKDSGYSKKDIQKMDRLIEILGK